MNSTPLDTAPDIASLESHARELAAAIPTWKKAKTYTYSVPQASPIDVDVRTANYYNDYWVARENTFDLSSAQQLELWEKFKKYVAGDDEYTHTHYEKNYIKELYDFKVKHLQKDTYVADLSYDLGFPMSKRKFYNYIHIVRDEKDFYVISVPINPAKFGFNEESGFVLARYASVEHVSFNGQLKWTMATASDAGGFIPKWVARMATNGAVAKDVPLFLEWASKVSV